MSRNKTKEKAGVGVWHCLHPSPSALTLPDWASAWAASASKKLIFMQPPAPRLIFQSSPRDPAKSFLPPHQLHEMLTLLLSAG
jgi:hypothetical protein